MARGNCPLGSYLDRQHFGWKVDRNRTRRAGNRIGIGGFDAAGVIRRIYRQRMRLGEPHRDRYLLRMLNAMLILPERKS
jgi:hypothetical protein